MFMLLGMTAMRCSIRLLLRCTAWRGPILKAIEGESELAAAVELCGCSERERDQNASRAAS